MILAIFRCKLSALSTSRSTAVYGVGITVAASDPAAGGACTGAPGSAAGAGADEKLREASSVSHQSALRFRGGLVFKAHRLLYHSTLGLRVIKKKKRGREDPQRVPK